MKSLAAITLVLALNSAVTAAVPWWAPSPISMAITVGQWIMADQEEVFAIRVQARGATDSQARDEALRLAVDRAVGSLMVTNTEMQNGEVTRHEIINYASGYVHDFTVVGRQRVDDEIEVTLDVQVKKSAIADRVLAQSQGTAVIPGDVIAQRHGSIMHERHQGDRILQTVLRDYPHRAYVIQVDQHQTRLTPERGLEIDISAVLTMNPKYLGALHEALSKTGNTQSQSHRHWVSLTYHHAGSVFRSSMRVGYDDDVRSALFQTHFMDTNPHIMVSVRGDGAVAFAQCFSHNELTQTGYRPSRRFVHWDQDRTIIDAQLTTRPRIKITLPADIVAQLRKIDVAVVSQQQCQQYPKSHIYK
jgi:hypothetical protein